MKPSLPLLPKALFLYIQRLGNARFSFPTGGRVGRGVLYLRTVRARRSRTLTEGLSISTQSPIRLRGQLSILVRSTSKDFQWGVAQHSLAIMRSLYLDHPIRHQCM